ncbi:hypothetical protein CALCODRAFT_893 [Calocera cornea HHB12733]|uniref:Uncharacterized protein n=1 Tax=Calocera cornea HHB12733 TaxID=1353952 RepID=A0A165K7A9_9BASI|nr:hypothetical protein CALCODRAFT_893 [Calocera cornea HHB12733]
MVDGWGGRSVRTRWWRRSAGTARAPSYARWGSASSPGLHRRTRGPSAARACCGRTSRRTCGVTQRWAMPMQARIPGEGRQLPHESGPKRASR